MISNQTLTPFEAQIAELIAWGANKKEVSIHLNLLENTVTKHMLSIFKKTRCKQPNELSAWWFCTNFHIPLNLAPFKKQYLIQKSS